jgi:hypothetical protein
MRKRKLIVTAASVAALAVPAAVLATPTAGPEPGPGCFGKWRAGSVQVYNETHDGNAGSDVFSVRAGDNASINADHREIDCAA